MYIYFNEILLKQRTHEKAKVADLVLRYNVDLNSNLLDSNLEQIRKITEASVFLTFRKTCQRPNNPY